jgi:hypothetical protein
MAPVPLSDKAKKQADGVLDKIYEVQIALATIFGDDSELSVQTFLKFAGIFGGFSRELQDIGEREEKSVGRSL